MTNNKKILRVLKGFMELNPTEKSELIRELNRFYNSPPYEKERIGKTLNEKLFSYDLGPTNDNFCPCCGKS